MDDEMRFGGLQRLFTCGVEVANAIWPLKYYVMNSKEGVKSCLEFIYLLNEKSF
jgi:hypothetical protein